MLMTPFPDGQMPENVKRWEDGPPYGRLELEIGDKPHAWLGDLEIHKDAHSGEFFVITRNVPCSLGACACAAEARWLPEYLAENLVSPDNTTHHLVNGKCTYCRQIDVSTSERCAHAPAKQTA